MIEVRDVQLALVNHEPARREVMARFRERGGSFSRWRRSDVEAMADALTRTEDALELLTNGRMTPARDDLKKIRRKLEDELNASESDWNCRTLFVEPALPEHRTPLRVGDGDDAYDGVA